MSQSARERMIGSAVHLFRRHGYSGTGFRDVIEHSGAPRGSIYHHFPGGKAQLGVEAVRTAGAATEERIRRLTELGDPAAGVDSFMRWYARNLERSGYRAVCPVLAVASESHPDAPELERAAAEQFERWERGLALALRKAGATESRARSIAGLVVAAIEGATVIARAQRDVRPIERARREIRRLIEEALPD